MSDDVLLVANDAGPSRAELLYETAVRAFLGHRPCLDLLVQAVALDHDFFPAYVLRGFCHVLLARKETMIAARADLENARKCVFGSAAGAAGSDYVEALDFACQGRFDAAIARLIDVTNKSPVDIVAIKLVHQFQFLAGRSGQMAAFTASALAQWRSSDPGYGFLLGCHAFALEESGQFRKAEAAAQSAMHFEPDDLWAMHALAHVYEMSGRNREGIVWLQSARQRWQGARNFSFHLAWHLALFHLNLGQHEQALGIYDADVMTTPSDDFRDIANAASLLWRLREQGVDTGERFELLAEIARRRATDTTLVFASLHHLLSLLATGDLKSARKAVDALDALAQGNEAAQSAVARAIGVPLAQTLMQLGEAGASTSDFGALVDAMPALGGSHAQRDVFLRTLALMAANNGDTSALDRVLAQRYLMRREDAFLGIVETRLNARLGRSAAARLIA